MGSYSRALECHRGIILLQYLPKSHTWEDQQVDYSHVPTPNTIRVKKIASGILDISTIKLPFLGLANWGLLSVSATVSTEIVATGTWHDMTWRANPEAMETAGSAMCDARNSLKNSSAITGLMGPSFCPYKDSAYVHSMWIYHICCISRKGARVGWMIVVTPPLQPCQCLRGKMWNRHCFSFHNVWPRNPQIFHQSHSWGSRGAAEAVLGDSAWWNSPQNCESQSREWEGSDSSSRKNEGEEPPSFQSLQRSIESPTGGCWRRQHKEERGIYITSYIVALKLLNVYILEKPNCST